MANRLDLEEQEQLDQLKHFWSTWGTLISSVLIVVFGCVAAWNGYQFWQNRQATQASALLDAIENAVQNDDQSRVQQAFLDIKNKYAATVQAGQAGLLIAKMQSDQGNAEAAKATLDWIAGNSSDEAYKSVARLRLASLLIEKKSYDEALQSLSQKFSEDFDAIVADRKGDIFLLQAKKQDAIIEYTRAYKAFSEQSEYRRLVEIKLNSLGVKPDFVIASAMLEAKK